MNDDVTPEPATAEDVAKPVAPAPKKIVRRGRLSPPETQTFERRLELTKAAARKLAREAKTKLPLRLGVSLELHEALVAIAEKIGASKVPDVAVRAMEIGAQQWASTLKIRADGMTPLTVFERTPAAANARDYGGPGEQRIRDEIAEQARQRAEEHAQQAEKLHVPGRRRAAAL